MRKNVQKRDSTYKKREQTRKKAFKRAKNTIKREIIAFTGEKPEVRTCSASARG
jgi:hypothetical protein